MIEYQVIYNDGSRKQATLVQGDNAKQARANFKAKFGNLQIIGVKGVYTAIAK